MRKADSSYRNALGGDETQTVLTRYIIAFANRVYKAAVGSVKSTVGRVYCRSIVSVRA
jgi:hypothetical protein